MERRRLDAHTKNGTTQQHKALQPQNLQAYPKINIDDWLFKPHIILNPRQAAAWPQLFCAYIWPVGIFLLLLQLL